MQDSWTGVEKLGGTSTLLLGVFDGHGSQGHCVSRNVAAILPRTLASCPLQRPQDCHDALASSLPACNQQLRRVSTMDCDLSGCTAVVSLLSGRNLVVANLGDSRWGRGDDVAVCQCGILMWLQACSSGRKRRSFASAEPAGAASWVADVLRSMLGCAARRHWSTLISSAAQPATPDSMQGINVCLVGLLGAA